MTVFRVLFTGQTFAILTAICKAQEHCGDYYCEQGTCCGERLCCTHYYYKTWWFWIIWCVLALLCCCCFYQKRRFQEKIRERMLRAYREGQLTLPTAETSSPRVPYPVPDGHSYFAPVFNEGQEVKLPAYDEISEIPQDPPAYDTVCNEDSIAAARISDNTHRQEEESPVFSDTECNADTAIPGGQDGSLDDQRAPRERHDTENSVTPLLGESD